MARWISLMLAVSAVGQVVAQSALPAESESKSEQSGGGTLELLGTRLAEVIFDETPFDQAINWLGKQSELDFVVRWSVLESAGIVRDAPVTLKICNLRLSQALWLILGEVGGADLRLAYRAEGSLVLISTAVDLEHEMITRVYDVSDLLTRVRQFKSCPIIDVKQAIQGGQLTMESETDTEDTSSGSSSADVYEESVEGLIAIVQTAVEPDSWECNGGRGSIQGYGKRLVVRNSIQVHQALAGHQVMGE